MQKKIKWNLKGASMKKLLITLIISSILLSSGCAGLGDYDITLPDGYSVIRTSAHMIKICKQEDEESWGEVLIPAKVVEVAWNDKYILAKQLGLKRNTDNPNSSYEIPDGTQVYYWILEMTTQKKFGPFSEKEFIEKKRELKISDNVILKSVDSYKKNY